MEILVSPLDTIWWQKELFIVHAQKRGLFLHYTGIEQQELFKTLQDPGPLEEVEEDNAYEYRKACKHLMLTLASIEMSPTKGTFFRNLKQEEGEMVDQFETWLQCQAKYTKKSFCNWENADHFEDEYRSSKLQNARKWHGKSTSKYSWIEHGKSADQFKGRKVKADVLLL